MNAIKVKDEYGNPVKGWSCGTTKAVHVMLGHKPRKVQGWSLYSPDGVERFNEGNWQQFVPFALLIISNYGYTTTLS